MKCTVLLLLIATSAPLPAQAETSAAAVHVRNSFTFTVDEPMHDAAALFGPEGERAWAGDDWNPQFVFPIPARDVEGAVFKVRHGDHTSVWVNTLFDIKGGRMQYVYFLDDLLVTTIDVRLHAIDAAHTKVDVTYLRTALRTEANDHVVALGKHDSEQGQEWAGAIQRYLQHRAASK